MAAFPPGLYALTPDEADTPALVAKVRAAIAGGAAAVQYRNKRAPAGLRSEQALALAALCRTAGVPLLVNDDIELALAVDAAGVHLGRDDGDLAAGRRRLGPGRLLGASCYDRLELAERAVAAGADYVAFGSMFASPTKPAAVRAPLALLGAARRFGVPIVAIGGITLDNAAEAIAAGADALAVITALFARRRRRGARARVQRPVHEKGRRMTRNDELFEQAQGLIPGGVNSPVRAFRAVGGTPRFFARGRGRVCLGRRRQALHRLCRLLGTAHPRARPSRRSSRRCARRR